MKTIIPIALLVILATGSGATSAQAEEEFSPHAMAEFAQHAIEKAEDIKRASVSEKDFNGAEGLIITLKYVQLLLNRKVESSNLLGPQKDIEAFLKSHSLRVTRKYLERRLDTDATYAPALEIVSFLIQMEQTFLISE